MLRRAILWRRKTEIVALSTKRLRSGRAPRSSRWHVIGLGRSPRPVRREYGCKKPTGRGIKNRKTGKTLGEGGESEDLSRRRIGAPHRGGRLQNARGVASPVEPALVTLPWSLQMRHELSSVRITWFTDD